MRYIDEFGPWLARLAVRYIACLPLLLGSLFTPKTSLCQTENLYERGEAALDASDYAAAEQLLARAEEQAPERTNALALRAKALIHLDRFEEAEHSVRDYLHVHQDSPDASYLLAYVLFRENRPAESLAAYTAAARLQRPSPSDFKIVGLDYVLLNDNPNAARWLERSVAEGPNDPEAFYHLGRIYYVQNSFDKAITCFKRASQLDSTYAKARDNLGLAYEGKNDLKEAETAYRDAIRITTQTGHPSEQPYINLADLLSRTGRSDDALTLLNTADQIAGKTAKTEEIRGRILFAQDRLDEAEAEFRAAVTSKPQDGVLHYLLGRVLKREGKAGEAEKEFAQTRKLLGTHSSLPN